VLVIGGVVYVVGLAALMLLWASQIETFWWLQVLNIFGLLLFAPLLLLMPITALLRSMTLGVATLLGLGLFGFEFWASLRPVSPPTATANLRVMTFNQLYYTNTPTDLLTAIREQQADVVSLQELTRESAQAIERELTDLYPYQFLLSREDTTLGLGLLSRRPFLATSQANTFRGQLVQIDVDGTPVQILNVYLPAPAYRISPRRLIDEGAGFDAGSRSRAVDRLLQAVETLPGPLIVTGDFNTSDREPDYYRLASVLQDVFRSTSWGFGYTYPRNRPIGPITWTLPLIRIDYVWVRGGVQPVKAEVDCVRGGSDHCLLVTEIQVP
jgi:endonuclease/exonuclease/phosphatase (EEP) superfamily protein YafD